MRRRIFRLWQRRIYEKLKDCWSVNEVKELKAKELQEAVKGAVARPITLDMALFGRMVTSNAFRDVEAAMQDGPRHLHQQAEHGV